MKRFNILKFAVPVLALSALTACEDWVTPQAEQLDPYALTEIAKDDAYYAALRAYKKSDHAIAFGWYDGWGDPGASVSNMLSSVPDSMDIISLWDNSRGLSKERIEDLRFVQEVKGTKVTVCTFTSYIGQAFTPEEYTYDTSDEAAIAEWNAYWGWEDGNDEAIRASIAKYAKAISDTLDFYGYDGLDIDYEPSGPLDLNMTYFSWLIYELGNYLGPQSGTGKLLIIDGYINRLDPSIAPYCDYFVSQAYSISGGTPPSNAGMSANVSRSQGAYMTGDYSLQARLDQIIERFGDVMSEREITRRFVATENLESAIDCLNGGYYWTDDQGRTWSKSVMPSLVGMASWVPESGIRKGGFGGYRFSNERNNTPMYKWMRKGIQQQNPSEEGKALTADDYVGL